MNVGTKAKTLEKYLKVKKLMQEQNLNLKFALLRCNLAVSTYYRLKAKYE